MRQVPVPTVPSSTETVGPSRDSVLARSKESTRDVAALVQFRSACLRGRSRRRATYGLLVVAAITVLAAWLPALLPGALGSPRADQVLALLPGAYLGVLVISLVSAGAAGGGRELLAREHATPFPVSATTDHLGALLMAPLNLAWLLQAWLVLGATAYVVGPTPGLLLAQPLLLLWLCCGTALGQAVAWVAEWLRRGRRGAWSVKAIVLVVAAVAAFVVGTGSTLPLVERAPTAAVSEATVAGARGDWLGWLAMLVVLGGLTLAALVFGGWMCARAARLPARAEQRVESSPQSPRANPASDFAALVRTDRAGIWRSVPLRRGLGVLVVLPGLGALAGNLAWDMLTIMPGLVASGGALLFGVNAWCLDGRGALWRDSLPVGPRLVFAARVVVLLEVMALATSVTLVLGSIRAGAPTAAQLAAVLCTAVVMCLQVVATSLRWSVRRPYPVDLRSARATPAPPLVMVGYSTRLAFATTLVALLFTVTSSAGHWQWSLLVAAPFLARSARKLVRTSREWATPETRALVVSTVAS